MVLLEIILLLEILIQVVQGGPPVINSFQSSGNSNVHQRFSITVYNFLWDDFGEGNSQSSFLNFPVRNWKLVF